MTNADHLLSRRRFLATTSVGTATAYGLTSGCGTTANAATSADVELTTQPTDHVIYNPSLGNGIMDGFPPPKEKLVTRDNWAEDPVKRRWALRHMRELFPTQPIPRGSGPVRVLPAKPTDISEWLVPDGRGGKQTVKTWLERTHTDAFLVLHRGNIVHEEYFDGMRDHTQHHLFSATKSIAAGVVAILLENNQIKADGQIGHYVPELKGTAYEDATIRHCLDMMSGVSWTWEVAEGESVWTKYERAMGMARKLPGEPLDEGEYHAIMKLDNFKRKASQPGTVFQYKESDTRVLSWVCEKVTGTRIADLIGELIWSKLGMEFETYTTCDGLGSMPTADGISVTLRNFARWGQMHLNKGFVGDVPVIPTSFIDDITRNADPSKMQTTPSDDLVSGYTNRTAYRNQFWVDLVDDVPSYGAGGYLDQLCRVFPKYGVVIVKLSNCPTESGISMAEHGYRQADAFAAIARQLT